MKKIYTVFLCIVCALAAGAQWNPDTTKNLAVSALSSSDIQTAATSDGKTYVAFYTPRGQNYFMVAQLLDANGNRLFGDSGIVLSKRKSGSATFVFNVCVDHKDNLVVGFQYQKDNDNHILMNKISPEGKVLWGHDGIDLGAGLSPSLVALTNNDIAVAWSNNGVINYQKLTQGGMPWDSAKTFKGSASVSRPQLVALPGKSFGMVYQQTFSFPFYTHLWEQRFDDNGIALWSQPVQLSGYATAGYNDYSVMSVDTVTYVGYFGNPTGKNRFDGLMQKVNFDGSLPWGINGTAFSTANGNGDAYQFYTKIAYDSAAASLWAVCTTSDFNQFNYGIAVQKLDAATGARLLGDKGKTVYPISANSPQQAGNLALCGGDPIFMFYDISNKLYATRLDAGGNFAWSFEKVTIGATTNQKGRYNFTGIANNQVVAVWQEDRNSGDMPFAQNVSCDGITGVVLPVALLNFRGNADANGINLYWQTATETGNKGFEIERAADGVHFSAIGFVASKAPHGNSSIATAYELVDAKPVNGDNYYRIKQVNTDGGFNYSNIILIQLSTNYANRLKNIYPNPVKDKLNLYIEAAGADKVRFMVTDVSGKTVLQQAAVITAGSNTIIMHMAGLAPGVYLLKMISSQQYEHGVQRFIKY